MARKTEEREDLLRDATAYVSRVQLHIPSASGQATLFAGFHANGAASFYFDQDPVYHFNRADELRRAFVDDLLLKAEKGRLVTMQRQRAAGEVALVTRVLTEDEQAEFLARADERFNELCDALREQQFTIEGIVDGEEDEDVVQQLVDYLDRLEAIRVANSPRVND